jgi:hypothetical protein
MCEIKRSKCTSNQTYRDNYDYNDDDDDNGNDDDKEDDNGDKTYTSATLVVYKIAHKHQSWNDFLQGGAHHLHEKSPYSLLMNAASSPWTSVLVPMHTR